MNKLKVWWGRVPIFIKVVAVVVTFFVLLNYGYMMVGSHSMLGLLLGFLLLAAAAFLVVHYVTALIKYIYRQQSL